MASPVLPKEDQNFIRLVKICLDVLKLPLVDILASEIQPADLYNKIQVSGLLLNGKNKLALMQQRICYLPPPAIPDYNNFDLTLLYTLIRNLCLSLEPTKGWGKDPVDGAIQIGDDIERLRIFRNNNVHNSSSKISDSDFETIWKKLKTVLQRIQNHMTSKGYNVNYEEKMTNIKQLDLGDEPLLKYQNMVIVEYMFGRLMEEDDREEPMISIEGPENVLCGNTAKFVVVTKPENLKGWSLTWQKLLKCTQMRINSNTEKYYGSTEKNLVIQSVCKEDEGGYQAILSKDSKANTSVSSNVIFLQAIGELPIFDVWNVTTEMKDIRIHYAVNERPPKVNEIKWIKDGVPILNRNRKYSGGQLNDNYFTITSPTIEDRGDYSCVVKNAVGSVQKDVRFDVPNAEISTEQQIYVGSETIFTPIIVACPSPDGVEWQQSNDGNTFESIIISKPKYHGSSCDPNSPLLIIPKLTFEDKLYYRLLVWNKIGKQYSNTVFLDVKGSVPNITISHRTCVSNRSISLVGDVFVYGDLPAVQNVFWTKNGKELNTEGSGGKYTKVTVDNPSLTIFEANEYDAGSYQLTATNAVGSTSSEFLILDVPDVSMAIHEQKNGRILFTVTTKSIPAPYFAQWSIKKKSADTFIPIDEQVEEFKGTSNTLPHPVLVVDPKIDLENYCFQVEVRNFIGSCKQITPVKKDEAGSGDLSTNDNQGGRLSEFYLDGGAGLKFAKLFDDIAEHFPEKKTKRLKNFIQYSHKVKDMTLFAQTVSARDCLEILCDHKLFTPWDVIFMQFLLKNTECMDLFEKCVEYAEAHGALCFYEKVQENGFRNVQFHVNGNISCYTPVEIRRIKEIVAAIVGCELTEIDVNGYRHSSSFLAVLSIEKKYVRKLLTMKQKEKDKLSRLNIDYFIVDFITVYLQSPKEIRGEENNDEYPIMLQNLLKISKNERIDCREKKSHLLLLQESYALPKGGNAHGRALFEKPSTDLDSDISDMYNAIQTARINVSAKEVKHISCLMSNRLWVSDMKKIKEIDENGRILRELNLYFTLFGSHTLTKGGDLIFLKDNDVYKLTSNGEISNLFIHASLHFCIHSSKANGDILIGDINIVTRFNISGMKLNQIEFDDEGQSLYEETIFITENKNGDIIVSDNGKKAIIVTDKSGRYLFNYKGHHSQTTFHPGGICTDILGHILVCNVSGDPSVHLLDKKGRFLAHLLTKHHHGSDCPQTLCVDSVHNLYVGYSNKNKINVFKYLREDMLFELYMEKNQPNVKTELTETRRIPFREFNIARKTNWAKECAVEPSDQLPEVPPTPPKKPFFKFDKYHEEKGSEKSDSETRLKSYSDPNVTHATSSDEQTIQYKRGNKKPSYWLISAPPVPPKMKIYSLKTKNTEKSKGKTESETRSKSYSDPNAIHATSSDEKTSYGLISGPLFSPRKKMDCFDTQNAEETDSAPPIPPRIQLQRVKTCISATKEKDFASAPPIPPRILIPKVRPCDSASIEEHSDLGSGYKEVQFHMAQGCLRKSRLCIRANAIDAVRSIVGCDPTDINGHSYDESNNYLNLRINELFLKKLLSLTHEEKNKLRKLFDYFIVDFITIYLERTKENVNESHHNVTHIMDEKTADRSKQGYVNLSEYDNIGASTSPRPSAISKLMKPIFALKGKPYQEYFDNSNSGVASSQPKINTAIHTKRINVNIHGVKHISCLTSNKMWVSDFNSIEEIDETGEVFMKLDVEFGVYGRHTVTREGNLLFLNNYSVYILTSNGDIRNLYISASQHSCIYASKINSDIFIGAPSVVNRYSESSKKLLKIQGDNLFGRPIYITENTNGDIIVSDEQRKAIVVVNKIGHHRFNYRGNHSLPEFNPRGVCTDVFGHILVCNHSYHDPSVHLLDENGHLLMSLLTKHRPDEDLPQDLCVDDKHNLYVGCGISKVIDVYKYLT